MRFAAGSAIATKRDPIDSAATSNLSIFAVIEEAATARRCLSAAALAAGVAPNGTVSALHIEVDPARIITAPEEISLQTMREAREGTSHERATLARRMFDFWIATNATTTATWLTKVGTVEPTLTKEAQNADLIVIARPHNMDSADALHAAIFDSGKLVLFVPDSPGQQSHLYHHIAIAWKARPQALRAVQQSLRWLRAADRVTVIAADERDIPNEMDDLTQFLSSQGIAPDVRSVKTSSKEHVADCILREADAIGADSIVMGAFRFGMIVEWVFGGVTREILERSKLPIFMMH
jgi:nucleotide-binding universal stress UspA family protein